MPAALGSDPTMAVRAAHLALRDLVIDRLETASEPCKRRDVRSLGPDVIELEHNGIALAAIDAAAAPKDRVEMGEVARDGRVCEWPPGWLGCVGSSPPPTSRGASSMAVDADDLATGDLLREDIELDALADQACDLGCLLADVVEFQHDRILFAAIQARVLAQKLQDVGSQLVLSRSLGRLRLIAMEPPTRPEVRGEARPTPPLAPFPEAVEELDGQVVPTTPAVAELTRAPDAEPSDGHRAGGPLGRCGRRQGRDHTANPHAHRGLRHPELARDPPYRPTELAPQPPCLRLFRILAFHEHMFASESDGFGV
jgi:hypothetical protein